MKRRRFFSWQLIGSGACMVTMGLWSFPAIASATDSQRAHATVNLGYFQRQVAKYSAVPKFTPPGPSFNALKAAKGKSIFVIPASSSIPFVQTIANDMGTVATQVGLQYTTWSNQGQPSQWTQGMQNAINRKVNSIDLLAGINPAVLGPQITAANRAGITTVVSHLYDLHQKPSIKVSAEVNIPYNRAGKLLADWAILKSKGKLDALVVTINEVLSTQPMVSGIRSEVNKCGSSCKLSFVNVTIPEVATRIQPQVQSALARDPKINYVIALYDSAEAPFASAGIKAAGATNRVKIVTFNGTASILKLVQNHDVVEMDIGENLNWIAMAIMDQHMRMLAGLKPLQNERIPLRIFSASNVNATGTPPRDSTGFGASYVAGYRKLWKLK